ncbi:N-acetyl-gamma-glutamyl-phosphate reductase [Halobacillus naozhouensis]|uniref:N-acetyl-gamma-glutamyl-phosphate reductase n=1 Tax=Halobacillus naozhouensis TaxID=554880 RepID=A0ABY8IWP7_9BACI|nr:N-acetyl-gamma-glutamyl-phosphate reductase [Halobacillus naozhouensis]WFT74654.1 N-acetyl-gamma-glutamyl-phosphate reductase [Halobacillus naozhouensis]
MKAGIVGATGYGGVELSRLLSSHSHIESITLYSSTQSGEGISESYSHLNTAQDQLRPLKPTAMKAELDVIFLATPAGVSRKLTPDLIGGKAKVIDLSGDLRLTDPNAYTKWYKKEPAPESVLKQAVYGLPEWNREAIQSAKLIANPGCFPTAALLGLGPLVKEKLLDPGRIVIDAKTGVSGAGKNPNPLTHFAHTQENVQIYKVNQHQHIPEIEQQLTVWEESMAPVTFSTHLIPMTRGIMATIYGELTSTHSIEQLYDCLTAYYGEQPFIRLRKPGHYPGTKDVYASNYCDIGITIDERTQRVTIVSVIDNLMKGAASQAIQNMNLAAGIEETTGLLHIPVYP